MHELTHPVELRDQELDLVAAGSGNACDRQCCGGDETTQLGLINFNNTNVGLNILGFQHQSAG